MKQLNFSSLNKRRLIFGGSLIKSRTNPKVARPLDSNLPVHLVLKADKSAMRLPRFYRRVNDIFAKVARKHGVRT